MAKEEKSPNQEMKELCLEKAKEVIILAMDEDWDKIWQAKNRSIQEGKTTFNIGSAVTLEKTGPQGTTVSCVPAWTESHKGTKKVGKVELTGELFTDPPQKPEGDEESESEDKPEIEV